MAGGCSLAKANSFGSKNNGESCAIKNDSRWWMKRPAAPGVGFVAYSLIASIQIRDHTKRVKWRLRFRAPCGTRKQKREGPNTVRNAKALPFGLAGLIIVTTMGGFAMKFRPARVL